MWNASIDAGARPPRRAGLLLLTCALLWCGVLGARIAAAAEKDLVAPTDTFPVLPFVHAAAGVPEAVVVAARYGVEHWFEADKRLRRLSPEVAGLDEAGARACAADRTCARTLFGKGIALVVFIDLVPSSAGLEALRVWAVSGVDGDTQLVGFQEFGGDGAAAYLDTITPYLVRGPTTEVSLKVEPGGATQHLNGWALPPGTERIESLVPGAYRLRTELTGHATDVREFTIGLMDDHAKVVEVALLPLSDGSTGKKVVLYLGVGAGVAAVLVGGIVLAVVLARGGSCRDGLGCAQP
jgi:hypothetical protein